jgi:hypothetical protein
MGFIEITERGAAGVGHHAQAHQFRLTYVQPNPTDEWRKFHDPAMARALTETARKSANIRARQLGLRGAQKQIADSKTDTGKVSKWTPGPSPTDRQKAAIGVQMDTGAGSRLDTTIYISGDRGGVPNTGYDAAAPKLAGASPNGTKALPSNPTLPSNARHAGSARLTVDALTAGNQTR